MTGAAAEAWLRDILLLALADAIAVRQAAYETCTDCKAAAGPCPDHARAHTLACEYMAAELLITAEAAGVPMPVILGALDSAVADILPGAGDGGEPL